MKVKMVIITIIILTIACILIAVLIPYFKMESIFNYDDSKLIGIIYLGGLEEDYDYSIVEKYYKTTEFETVELGGAEKYLIIPKNNNIDVFSLEWGIEGDITEKFVKSLDTPFYITCNQSDIFANCVLRITSGDKKYEYTPYISLKDGSIVIEDFVFLIEK